MSLFTLLKFLHVLLAITAVGANVTYGVWLSRGARDPRHLPFALRGVKMLDDRLANPAYALLLVTGVAIIYADRLAWTTPWLLVSLFLYGVLVVLGLAGYTPLLRREIAVLEAEGPDSPAYQRLSGRGTLLGALIAVVVLVITFLMVTKPVLWG